MTPVGIYYHGKQLGERPMEPPETLGQAQQVRSEGERVLQIAMTDSRPAQISILSSHLF